MQKREMNAATLDSLSMLVSAYSVLDIVFKYGVENGLTDLQCENLEALATVLNEQFDRTTDDLYRDVNTALTSEILPENMGG